MKNRGKNAALVAAGIMIGTTIGGPAANAAEMLAAVRSTQKIFINGERAQMEAYAINGSNYVKLRDLGSELGVEVSYDAATNNVYVGKQPEQPQPTQTSGRIVTLPTDGSKYTPQAGDLIPWREVELTKHLANIPRGRFRVESWDYYRNNVYLETRYYICTI